MKNKKFLAFIGAGALAGCLCIAGEMESKAATALAAHIPQATSAPPAPHSETTQVTYSESQTAIACSPMCYGRHSMERDPV
jgi:hypothetical protein